MPTLTKATMYKFMFIAYVISLLIHIPGVVLGSPAVVVPGAAVVLGSPAVVVTGPGVVEIAEQL